MSRKINEPHDVRLKELFWNKEAFFSLLKDCVKAEWVADLDVDSLKRSETSFILQDFKKKEADIVYEATINNGRQKVIFYLLLELQSKVDYRMPYRLLLYITEVLRHHYNNSDVKMRDRKNFKFPAVVPIVFFSGSRKWTVPTNLREMFGGHKRFGGSLLDFSYALVDVKGFNDETVAGFHSRLLKIMMMFEKSKNVEELIEVIKKYEGDIALLDDEELRLLTVAIDILGKLYGTGETDKIDNLLKTTTAERVTGMLSDLIANEKKREKEIRREAREQGRELEKIETAKRLLGMGLTFEQVAEGSRLTIEEVRKLKTGLNQ